MTSVKGHVDLEKKLNPTRPFQTSFDKISLIQILKLSDSIK